MDAGEVPKITDLRILEPAGDSPGHAREFPSPPRRPKPRAVPPASEEEEGEEREKEGRVDIRA